MKLSDLLNTYEPMTDQGLSNGSFIQAILNKYPALSGYGYTFIDSRGKQPKFEGQQLEFYHPDENENPNPGRLK